MRQCQQEWLERELGRRGRFEGVSSIARKTVRYVTLPSAAVVVDVRPGLQGHCALKVTCRFTTPMSENISEHIICSPSVEQVARARGMGLTMREDGLPVLSTEVTLSDCSKEVSDRLRRLFIRIRNAVLSVQAEMRRINMAQFVAPSSNDEFWAETTEEADSRLLETSREVKTVTVGGIRISYTDELAGGGQVIGSEMVDFIEKRIGQVNRA